MAVPIDIRSRYAALFETSSPPLDEACALIAAEETEGVDPLDLIAKLDVFAEGLWVPPEAGLSEKVARLNHHLFTELGFTGDREDYGSVRNSLLDQVLERRLGLPILLCVVAMEIGRRAGVPLDGIGFPGHFLVSPTDAEPRFWIDPFNAGRILTRDALLERLERMAGGRPMPSPDRFLGPVPDAFVVLRVNNNLKGAHLRAGDIEGALRAVERLLIIDDTLASEQRDRGLMLHHLSRFDEAAEQLSLYLERWPSAPDREKIEEILKDLL